MIRTSIRRASSLPGLVSAACLACAGLPSQAAGDAQHLDGIWSWSDERQCRESYEYRSDGTGVVSSGSEQSNMIYTLAAQPVADGFFQMNTTITRNSGGTDCLGANEDDAGATYTVFVKFLPEQDAHIVCYQPNLRECFGPLFRGR